MPEDHALALFLKVEQVHDPADAAVVALFGLFDPGHMLGEVRLGRPGRAIDALQLGIVLIAAPIGTGQLGQLKALTDMFGRGQVRAAAEILPSRALMIDGDRLTVGQPPNDLGLIGLAHGFEISNGSVAVDHFTPDRLIALDDLTHTRFDLGQIIKAKGLIAGKVVIEAVLDIGTDGHLSAGEQFLNRLGQDVGRIVANDLKGVLSVTGQNLNLAIGQQISGQGPVEIE